jgi:hypothetical protein
MKTEKLFNYYASILNENVEGGSPDATDIAEIPADVAEAGTEEMTTEGERVLCELLVQAFLYEPKEDDAAIGKELQEDVKTEPKVVAAKIRNLLQLGDTTEMKDTLDTVDV